MSQSEARAWWADVEHLRESIERRRDAETRPRRTPVAEPPPERTSARRDDARATARFERRPDAAGRDDELAPRRAARTHAASRPDRRATTAVRASRVHDHELDDLDHLDDARGHAPRRRTVHLSGRTVDAPPVRPLRAPPGSSSRRRGRSMRRAAVGPRPDRVAMWAVILGFVLIFVAATSAHGATHLGDRTLKPGMQGRDVRHLQLRLRRAGFLRAPATGRYGPLTQTAVRGYQRSRCLTADGIAGPATIRALRRGAARCRRAGGHAGGTPRRAAAYRRTMLGTRTLERGMRGSDVRTLQRLLGVESTGTFGPKTQRAVRRLQRRAGLVADGSVGPDTRAALAQRTMRPRTATWYGPGLYGKRTACGMALTHRLRGVAHRRLPCGTAVTLSYGGRFVTVRVVDRGPYRRGVTFDLTSATAQALGMATTARIRVSY